MVIDGLTSTISIHLTVAVSAAATLGGRETLASLVVSNQEKHGNGSAGLILVSDGFRQACDRNDVMCGEIVFV